jgi:CubicO group peptidase (beta-lactamase class C family)
MDFEKLIPEDFSGVVSVRRNGTDLFRKAYGYADAANRRENRADTKFPTASAGKGFTAAGTLRLIEEGKLRLSDTLGSVLKRDWKAIDPNITVEQLLTHTSGIPDYFDEETMEDYAELWRDYPNYKIRTSSDLLPLFLEKPMLYPAGSRFQYNNTGYVVLGLILERISGMPFDRFLEEAVFRPLGMKNTGYYELDRLPGNCANAYLSDEACGEYYTNIYSVDAKGTGAGGAFTTAEDLHCFWDGLLSGALLSKETVFRMLMPQVSDGEGHCYGYGVWFRESEQYRPFLQGEDPGVCCMTSCDLKHGVSTAFISNFGQDVWKLHRKIITELGCVS